MSSRNSSPSGCSSVTSMSHHSQADQKGVTSLNDYQLQLQANNTQLRDQNAKLLLQLTTMRGLVTQLMQKLEDQKASSAQKEGSVTPNKLKNPDDMGSPNGKCGEDDPFQNLNINSTISGNNNAKSNSVNQNWIKQLQGLLDQGSVREKKLTQELQRTQAALDQKQTANDKLHKTVQQVKAETQNLVGSLKGQMQGAVRRLEYLHQENQRLLKRIDGQNSYIQKLELKMKFNKTAGSGSGTGTGQGKESQQQTGLQGAVSAPAARPKHSQHAGSRSIGGNASGSIDARRSAGRGRSNERGVPQQQSQHLNLNRFSNIQNTEDYESQQIQKANYRNSAALRQPDFEMDLKQPFQNNDLNSNNMNNYDFHPFANTQGSLTDMKTQNNNHLNLKQQNQGPASAVSEASRNNAIKIKTQSKSQSNNFVEQVPPQNSLQQLPATSYQIPQFSQMPQKSEQKLNPKDEEPQILQEIDLNLKEFAQLEEQIIKALKKPDQMDYSKLKLSLPGATDQMQPQQCLNQQLLLPKSGVNGQPQPDNFTLMPSQTNTNYHHTQVQQQNLPFMVPNLLGSNCFTDRETIAEELEESYADLDDSVRKQAKSRLDQEAANQNDEVSSNESYMETSEKKNNNQHQANDYQCKTNNLPRIRDGQLGGF